ncbi:MAG TPA: hypothetical protein VFX16_11325 [Pseudonocardiaceae bacterium]|nr:hypothetical protein [Pseudonocardiaceae bacterium]
MTEPGGADQRTPLDLLPGAVLRRRATVVSAVAVVMGGVFGVVFGLVADWLVGLLAAIIVCVPLVMVAVAEARRHCWLVGGTVFVRAIGTRSVDLRQTTGMELLITRVRGSTVVGVLATGPPKGKTINVAVATYTGGGGRELDILALRRLADALAAGSDTNGLVFAELLVAQLRAEARGEAPGGRPLYRVAAMAPGGRLTYRIPSDAVGTFVSSLD